MTSKSWEPEIKTAYEIIDSCGGVESEFLFTVTVEDSAKSSSKRPSASYSVKAARRNVTSRSYKGGGDQGWVLAFSNDINAGLFGDLED